MNKRITIPALLCTAALLAACASGGGSAGSTFTLTEAVKQAAEKTARDLPAGSRVAVVSFESENSTLSGYVMEEFNGELFDRGVDVVDRQNLEHVLREQNFQMSGYVSDESALSIGKFLGADIVITGQLTAVGGGWRFVAKAVSVETAVRVSMIRLDVRNDAMVRRLLNAQ